jgi:uncharacterized membrane protein
MDTNGKTESEDKLWMKLMELGERAGCHQKPERSFFYHGYQFPVCARCTGAILGFLLAVPAYLLMGFLLPLSISGILILLADWLLQAVKVKESTNRRRLITGLLGGYGVMSFQLMIVCFLWIKIGHFIRPD